MTYYTEVCNLNKQHKKVRIYIKDLLLYILLKPLSRTSILIQLMRVSQEFWGTREHDNFKLGNWGLKPKYPQFGTGEHKTVFGIKGTIMKEKYNLTP